MIAPSLADANLPELKTSTLSHCQRLRAVVTEELCDLDRFAGKSSDRNVAEGVAALQSLQSKIDAVLHIAEHVRLEGSDR